MTIKEFKQYLMDELDNKHFTTFANEHECFEMMYDDELVFCDQNNTFTIKIIKVD